MSIYIMDKTNIETGISYAKMDEEAKIILIQDGLYASPELFEGMKVFSIFRACAMVIPHNI